MTIQAVYDDSAEIVAELRLMAAQAMERGDVVAYYWLAEAATHIEGLYDSAVALEKKAAKAGVS